jgi:hypothetical protein
MLVLPVGSVLIEMFTSRSAASPMLLVGKWFVFWAVGARLFLAGLNQCLRPGFTAERILGIRGKEAFVVIRELGFSNLAMGAIGLCSIFATSWVTPSAVLGGILLGLASINHLARRHRTGLENIALSSNLLVFGVLLCYCVAMIAH